MKITRSPTILLSSSAHAFDPTVRLKEHELRVFHTLESIKHWIRISPDLRLVLCDGSGFDFSQLVAERFPGIKIETLFFSNDRERIRKQGKGYGEGEIIKHALNHSRLLRDEDCFVKCTGKLWVDNFAVCLEEWHGELLCAPQFKHVFSLRPTTLVGLDTRFYVVDQSFYRKNLIDAHLTVDAASCGIEQRFLSVVLERGITGIFMNTPPDIQGVQGGSGGYIKSGWRRRMKNRLRLAIARRNRNFGPLFCQPN